jgi:hypothetical protein
LLNDSSSENRFFFPVFCVGGVFCSKVRRKPDFCHGICYGAGGNSTYLGLKTSIKSWVFGDIFSLWIRRLQVQVLPDAPIILLDAFGFLTLAF